MSDVGYSPDRLQYPLALFHCPPVQEFSKENVQPALKRYANLTAINTFHALGYQHRSPKMEAISYCS